VALLDSLLSFDLVNSAFFNSAWGALEHSRMLYLIFYLNMDTKSP
jgi:hypothetical protein